MGLPELLPLFAQSGALGIFAWLLYRFFRSAVDAHKGTAAAYKAAWEAEVERSTERDRQVAHMLTAIRDATAAREKST